MTQLLQINSNLLNLDLLKDTQSLVQPVRLLLLRTLEEGDGEEEGDQKGPEWLDFHGKALTISWLLIIDIAVIIAAFRWQKYSAYVHALLAFIIIGLTLGGVIPALKEEQFLFAEDDPAVQKVHNVAGFVATVWLGVQLLTGILSRVIQYSAAISPNTVKVFKLLHSISGYLLMILFKFNYLIIKWIDDKLEASFILLILAEIPFLIIYLLIKIGYWTLAEETVDSQIKVSLEQKLKQNQEKSQQVEMNQLGGDIIIKNGSDNHQIQYLNTPDSFKTKNNQVPYLNQNAQLEENSSTDKLKLPYIQECQTKYTSESLIPIDNYVLFNDFVYDISDFSGRHPGGEKIISLMKKRQINRFMYGSYSAELTPNVKPWQHTKDAMRLVGPPVAQIQRISPIQGLADYNKMVIQSKTVVSGESTHPTFLLHLKKQSKHTLKWKGFTQASQIGQYFSLTVSDKKGWNRVTRLYTNIWCMRPQNLQLIKSHFPELKEILQGSIFNQKEDMQSNNTLHFEDQNSEEVVPLVIKRYEKGELVQKFLGDKGFDGEILLSKSMGPGMKYGEISEDGKVIIVCGGTGLLPFCDFIDLLFKRVVHLEGKPGGIEFSQRDSLVKEDLIKKRTFKIYCAAESSSDLLPLTLYQINYLSKSQKIDFEAVFRIRNDSETFTNNYPSIQTQRDFFNNNIVSEIKVGNISQIYVCGPPQMNASIGLLLENNETSKGIYHFM